MQVKNGSTTQLRKVKPQRILTRYAGIHCRRFLCCHHVIVRHFLQRQNTNTREVSYSHNSGEIIWELLSRKYLNKLLRPWMVRCTETAATIELQRPLCCGGNTAHIAIFTITKSAELNVNVDKLAYLHAIMYKFAWIYHISNCAYCTIWGWVSVKGWMIEDSFCVISHVSI